MSRTRHPFRVLLTLGALLASSLMVVVLPATPAAAVPGLNIQTAVTAVNTDVFKNVPVFCPTGQRVYGSGAALIGANQNATITSIEPSTNLEFVSVSAQRNIGVFTQSWGLRAWAICGNPQPTQVRAVALSPSDTTSTKTAMATCPGGTDRYGLGGQLVGSDGKATWRVENIGNTARATGTAFPFDPPPGNWRVGISAVCATATPTLERVTASSPSNLTGSKSVEAVCPAGKQLHGTAWSSVGNDGNVVITEIRPLADRLIVRADSKAVSSSWLLRAQAVCSA